MSWALLTIIILCFLGGTCGGLAIFLFVAAMYVACVQIGIYNEWKRRLFFSASSCP
jgi:hypothetical protein